MYDLLIKNGFLADGTGEPGRVGDVAAEGERIVKIDREIREEARTVIDAAGMMVSPGFVDVHTHDDLVFDLDPMNLPKLRQGVTTVITGNCGFGAAPAAQGCRFDLAGYNGPILGEQVERLLFPCFEEYLDHMEQMKKAMNVACLVPHGSIYLSANGAMDREPDEEGLKRELAFVEEAMDAGALGLSFGLMYAPGCYSKRNEIWQLAAKTGEMGGIVTIHMKSESDHFEECVREAAELSRHCKVPVEISHLKQVGKGFRGRMKENLRRVKQILEDGADLSFDMYPYTMGSTTMSILFPTEYLKGGVEVLLNRLTDPTFRKNVRRRLGESWGEEDNLSLLCGWDNVILSSVRTQSRIGLLGKSIEQVAGEWHMEPEEAFLELFWQEGGDVSILLNHIAREDMEETLLFERVNVASDGLPGARSPHPRLYGTFPKFLREFVRETNRLTWEEAIHKITGQPARRFGLKERGILKEGYFADITIFDPRTISDKADFQNPKQYPVGISHVIVNGCRAWSEEGVQNAGQGRLIRGREL